MALVWHEGTELPFEEDYGDGLTASHMVFVKIEHVFGEFIEERTYDKGMTICGRWSCSKAIIDMDRPKIPDYWRVVEWCDKSEENDK